MHAKLVKFVEFYLGYVHLNLFINYCWNSHAYIH